MLLGARAQHLRDEIHYRKPQAAFRKRDSDLTAELLIQTPWIE